MAILANSRPYEGLVLAIPFVGALGIWLSSRRAPPAGVAFRRIVLPLGCVLLVTGTWMLYYNFRVTGELLTTPYQLYERTYASIPVFVFQDGRPAPLYRHEQMRSYYGAQAEGRGGRSVSKLATVIQSRARRQAVSYFGSLLVVAAIVISLPFERNRWQHLAALTLGVFTVGLCVTSWTFPHYAAPAAGLALLITVRAMRRVGAWRLGGIRLGRPLAQALGVLTLAILAVGIYRRSRPPEPEIGWRYDRARIAADLSQSGAMQSRDCSLLREARHARGVGVQQRRHRRVSHRVGAGDGRGVHDASDHLLSGSAGVAARARSPSGGSTAPVSCVPGAKARSAVSTGDAP